MTVRMSEFKLINNNDGSEKIKKLNLLIKIQ